MDNRKKHINEEVNKTLNALDDMERATTDDFFYSRLMAKMEQQNQAISASSDFDRKFVFSAAAVFIIMLLNIAYLSSYNRWTDEAPATERQQLVEELANDFQTVDLSYLESFEEQ